MRGEKRRFSLCPSPSPTSIVSGERTDTPVSERGESVFWRELEEDPERRRKLPVDLVSDSCRDPGVSEPLRLSPAPGRIVPLRVYTGCRTRVKDPLVLESSEMAIPEGACVTQTSDGRPRTVKVGRV